MVIVVEDVKTFECGDAIVELSISVGEAIGEGGKETKDGAKSGEGCSEGFVDWGIGSVVWEEVVVVMDVAEPKIFQP
ncbi:hypothetical protein F0562_019839 [Nyssa sinensis]|uniref:Uncharacterized protein n=1 Tax=Nyssa sinensis TaxID=561372 RepID=A0A5J5BTK2_9ASTE|nr:hypothetical protein F0562_019839 [Nyssa sinensis]